MTRLLAVSLFAFAVWTLTLPAQEASQKGRLKKLDLDRMIATLTVQDKDREFRLTEDMRVLDAVGKTLKEKLSGFKDGVEVFFVAGKRDDQDVLRVLKLAEGGRPGLPKVDLAKLRPLTELGAEKYQDFQGGLYPDGKNERPAAHEALGLRLAKQVQPLNADGKPSPDGKIVLLSIGMSNTSQASQGFQKALQAERGKNPQLLFVNGAQGGMTASVIQNPKDKRGADYWAVVDERLKKAGVSRAQVQVVWIKQADAGPTQGFPGYAQKLQGELARIVQLLPERFPNCKLAYLSSRTCGGFAKTGLNPEPYAYESGFSVKWLIEQQLKGEAGLNCDPDKGAVKAPWLSWGAYLWTSGATKREDGFSYVEGDFIKDGTHLSASGMEKVGNLMAQFFRTDTTSRLWFLAK